MYLEDMGPAESQEETAVESAPNGATDYQVVWQLEMWKRAEMAKFLVHLK
jgi:hypothetical protein